MRKMKDVVFFDIDDGSPRVLQVVIEKGKVPKNLTFGSSVETKGILNLNKNKQIELLAENVEVIGNCDLDDEYPFLPKKSYSDEYLRQYLHFRSRTHKFGSLLRIRNSICFAIHKYFIENNFIQIHTPVLTSNDCEGAGEVFCVAPYGFNRETNSSEGSSFFGDTAYLTVSGQLHLEVMARSMGNVYSFGPTFRAENSKSRLHLSEFYMVEAEMAFTYTLEEIMKFCENLIRSVTETVLNVCGEDISKFKDTNVVNSESMKFTSVPFTVITYQEAAKILDKNKRQLHSEFHFNNSLSKEHELFLVKYNGNMPMFIIEWPKCVKPFYMKSLPENNEKVMGFDLLSTNVGEICGGSLREDDIDKLQDSLLELKLQNKLHWYLQLRKYGNIPTGGFGIGFERYIQTLLGIPNIKDTIPFPRWPHSCKL
ncbi:hypothetical protein AAG570_007669 [Ranatra chinensis]|uniref:asparagine--tRNA ligase n=1 Tax=Ranatra chinensis TaxID=642074 RepID=A0ABD0YI26_9HEMI